MERNDAGNGGVRGDQPDANEFSGSPPPQSDSPSTSQRTDAGDTGDTGDTGKEAAGFDFSSAKAGEGAKGMRDRARNAIGTAGAKLADVGSTVRDRAGSAKDKLADSLETGAEKLRQRGQTGGGSGETLAGATAAGSTPIEGDGRIAQVSDRLAGGMDATADWLREADLDSLKTGLERQVREHPGRTLLIAAGLGYLIGRAFRNNQ